MLGGVVSALVVGTIVDQRNLYANIVADSYAQEGRDENFWKSLSGEEQSKAQDMVVKLRQGGNEAAAQELEQLIFSSSRNGSSNERASALEPAATSSSSSAPPTKETTETRTTTASSSGSDMFSDYE